MPRFSIHKEGRKIILFSGALLIAVNTAIEYIMGNVEWLQWSVGTFSIVMFFLIVWFFRIPKTEFTLGPDKIIAPADGRVVVIEETEEKEYFKDRRVQVSIFMSPTNVHVNRNPISGEVLYTKYHPGEYLVAWHPKSSERNEHQSVVLGNEHTAILVKQIAGKLARRIINYLEVGRHVEQGDELGFIKFGSRVDVFLPLDTNITVDIDDAVKGGVTVLATVPH